MVRGEPHAECQRSYLGEEMPAPTLPKTAKFQGVETIDDDQCEVRLMIPIHI